MNSANKNLKKIIIVLIGIILLPALFYTGYELTALSENEEIIEEIYRQQLDVLLFSVNQHAWDYIDSWANKIENKILNQRNKPLDLLFMDESINNNLFPGLLVYQNPAPKIYSIKLEDNITQSILNETDSFIINNNDLLKNLKKMKDQGYRKIEPIIFPASMENSSNLLGLLFTIYYKDKPLYIVLIIDSRNFIDNVISTKLYDIAGPNLSCGIFDEFSEQAKTTNQSLSFKDAVVRKKLWVFPNHTLGIGLKGSSISDLAEQRLYRSIFMIVFLDLILLAGGWFIFRNIRKEVRLAQLKSDFVSNVSHELRTPLSLIRMYAETLEMGRVADESKKTDYYKNISQESERLTHLINNILNFSRMESGKKDYHFETIEINNLVRDIFNIYKDHVKGNGFEYTVDYFKGELNVLADKTAISEALINLIDNAIKYSLDKKSIIIKTGHDKGAVFIEVLDHGIGIDPVNYKKVFENFFRETTGHVHNTKGSGLGLSLVKHIVDAHKGEIKLKSSVGKGSTFRLVFPKNEG